MDVEQGLPDDYAFENESVQVEGNNSYGIMSAVAAILVPGGIIAFFVYKLVMSLKEKQRLKEEKKKLKVQRKEKEQMKKQKKK